VSLWAPIAPLAWDRSLVSLLVAERNAAVQTLGNLTLVTNKLNPAMSNGPWPAKQKALNEHSVLLLNSRLVEQNPDYDWLRTSLNEMLREAILSDELALSEFLHSKGRRQVWDACQAGRTSWRGPWALAVLPTWPAANGLSWP